MAADPALTRVIRAQHGAVTLQQLLGAGLTRAKIATRVSRGQFHRVHQGVYATADPALLPRVRASAALLATGPDAVLSHRSAAVLWGLANTDSSKLHVTLPGRHDRRHAGLTTHRVRSLDRADVTVSRGLRLTTAPRTVIDFAAEATLAEIERALSEGRALGLITDAQLEAALTRVPRTHRGAAKVKALMNRQVGRVLTRSERERRLLDLFEAAGLPKPLVNQPLLGYQPDFYWPEYRLILEFDGYTTHGSRRKFESDRRRDQRFAAAGIQTLRATWLQFEREPVALVVRVGQAMAARAA